MNMNTECLVIEVNTQTKINIEHTDIEVIPQTK